jgi:hypothetical protein
MLKLKMKRAQSTEHIRQGMPMVAAEQPSDVFWAVHSFQTAFPATRLSEFNSSVRVLVREEFSIDIAEAKKHWNAVVSSFHVQGR